MQADSPSKSPGPTLKNEFIVVADSASARLLRRDSDTDPLVPIETLRHDAGRGGPEAPPVSDRPGHGSADHHSGGVSFQPRTDPKRREEERFAHRLAQVLEQGVVRGEYRLLSVYAPARFLGELKSALGPAASKALRLAVDLDLMPYGLDELERRIANVLSVHAAHGEASPG